MADDRDGAGRPSPLERPVTYPGRPLRRSGLLTGTGFVEQDEPVTQGRRPVLAIGSNADPAQLRRKLGPGLHVPVTAVDVIGVAVAHSAHIGPPGYIPYAPLLLDDVRLGSRGLPVVVLWLDAAALVALDRTEPNYHRVPLPGTPYQVYRSRWGLLPAVPGGPVLPAGDQAAAYRALAFRPWFAELVPEAGRGWPAAVAALRVDPARRERLRARLAAEGPAADGWP